MAGESIDRWPSGERPVYFATPRAWELLHVLESRDPRQPEVQEALAGSSLRDVRGAYFLTRDLAALRRREVLVEGDDEGRARRIQVRNILKRAYRDLWLQGEGARREREAVLVQQALRERPPTRPGWRRLTPPQVLTLARSLQPLELRVRRLLELDPGLLREVRDQLAALATAAQPNPRWPHGPQAEHLAWVLGVAIQATPATAAPTPALPHSNPQSEAR
jgi:hypothetical protein